MSTIRIVNVGEGASEEEVLAIEAVKACSLRLQDAISSEGPTVAITALSNTTALVAASAGLSESEFVDAMRRCYRAWEQTALWVRAAVERRGVG